MAKGGPGGGETRARPTGAGICIICGQERRGAPAEAEFPVIAARKLRAALSMPARHTVVCSQHFHEARQRRAAYEQKARNYALVAALFFVFMVCGSFFFGNSSLMVALPALAGALAVALLPHFYYFPSFGK